ncbi:MAG: RcnB family protein [Betaproteobacteria bacterium]|nr:RcnB family protein [Betaproteobacteria bacterium]
MNRKRIHNAMLAMLLAPLAVLSSPVLAEKPAWAGSGKGKGEEREHRGKGRDDGAGKAHEGRESQSQRSGGHFGQRQQLIVRDYYVQEFRGGHCPPGLAKKNNGCMPPGQAKKWQLGRPLPAGVGYHDLPRDLVIRLGMPPSGHKYVRVAADILLIAVGTSLVVDAITDLGRM